MTGSRSIRIPVRVPPSLRIAVRNSNDEKPAATMPARSRIGTGRASGTASAGPRVWPTAIAMTVAPTSETDEVHERGRVRGHRPVAVAADVTNTTWLAAAAEAEDDAQRVDPLGRRRAGAAEQHERHAQRGQAERQHPGTS